MGAKNSRRDENSSAFAEMAAALSGELRRERDLRDERLRQERALAREKEALPEPGGEQWRSRILEAIDRRDERGLQALLEGGPAPIFLGGPAGERKSPLGHAASKSWEPGIRLLLDAGAEEPEGLVLEASEAALEIAAGLWEEGIFRMLLESEKSADRRVAAAREAAEFDVPCFQAALDILGSEEIRQALGGAGPFGDGYDHMSFRKGSWRAQNAARTSAVLRLVEMFPDEAKTEWAAWKLWTQALRHDLLELAEGLAKAGVEPWRGAEIPVRAEDAGRWSAGAFVWDLEGDAPRKEGTSGDPDRPMSLTPLAIACAANSSRMRRALIRSPAMIQKTMDSEDSVRLLSGCFDQEALKDLKEAGADLERLRDPDSGRNPLHALAVGGEKKTAMRKGLSLCPAWGLQEDIAGAAPAALCESREVRADLERALASKAAARAPRGKGKAPRRGM